MSALFILLTTVLFSANPMQSELSRLEGHDVEIAADRLSYQIRDIAGEGPPLVGLIHRNGESLVIETGGERLTLRGPLAVPRIAGPGYKVWLIGSRDGDAITVRRIGILSRPTRANSL